MPNRAQGRATDIQRGRELLALLGAGNLNHTSPDAKYRCSTSGQGKKRLDRWIPTKKHYPDTVMGIPSSS